MPKRCARSQGELTSCTVPSRPARHGGVGITEHRNVGSVVHDALLHHRIDAPPDSQTLLHSFSMKNLWLFSVVCACIGGWPGEVCHAQQDRELRTTGNDDTGLFQRRLRCKDEADAYAKTSTKGNSELVPERVEFSLARQSCVAAFTRITNGKQSGVWSYETIDILTGESLYSGECVMNDPKNRKFCGNGRDMELRNRRDDALQAVAIIVVHDKVRTEMKGIISRWLAELGPEWAAAIALGAQAIIFLLQALILGWQGVILRRHASTMEKHTEIAGTQAETAKLIGQALDQQGKVLDTQTKIMDAQFRFQRKIEAQAERANVFNLVLELRAQFVAVKGTLKANLGPGTQFTQASREKIESAWHKLSAAIVPCQKALITSIHLSQGEKNYFMGFAQAVDLLERGHTNTIEADLKALQALEDTYKDFLKKMMGSAQTPDN